MNESEHLSGFGVGAVHKNQGCVLINEHKATKLSRVQLAVGVIADHTIRDHDYPDSIDCVPKSLQRGGPCLLGLSPVPLQP